MIMYYRNCMNNLSNEEFVIGVALAVLYCMGSQRVLNVRLLNLDPVVLYLLS